jgi:hypothetical protein
MSLRNRLVLPILLSGLAVLAGCGSSSTTITPPPGGSFDNSDLSGTYVFSVSGTDSGGQPYAILGTLTADGTGGNGNGGITGGTIDINDAAFLSTTPVTAPIPNAAISSSSTYSVSKDGRGTAKLGTSTPFGTIVLSFVLQSNSHGLVTEFDNIATGSGTLDLQTSGLTQASLAGPYAFTFSGIDANDAAPFATVGAFVTNATGGINSGAEDFNDGGFAYANQSLGGQVVLGPSSTPSTVLSTGSFSLTFDVYAIDATHLKFIEMDALPIVSGDAYSQPSATISGTMAFVLVGSFEGNPAAAGGFMVTDGGGNITTSSTEDAVEILNGVGTPTSAPIPFSAAYSSTGNGRFTLNNFSGFFGAVSGGSYAAYPSSGGVLLLETDNNGIMTGAAYPQGTPLPSFASAEGYGLNLTGLNIGNDVEVDDIAEFTAASTAATCNGTASSTVCGIIGENFDPGGSPIANLALAGTFGAIDSNGRVGISANAGTSSSSTLNGGFGLTLYTTDGITFPFIESDGGQIATGVVVEQSSTGGAAAATRAHMFVPRPLVRANTTHKQKK